MKNNFKLFMIGGPYGDFTSDYEAYFDKPFKVKDFLSIIEKEKDEWGTINFIVPEIWSFEVRYEHGIINYKDFARFSGMKNQTLFNMKIKKITANGGWSSMIYTVILEY